MNIQELYNLAERELIVGLPDQEVMKRALQEAGGVKAVARQAYWRLRSDKLAAEAKVLSPEIPDLYLREIKARLDSVDKSRRLRGAIVGWFWAFACFAGLAGAFIFFRAARAAYFAGRSSYSIHAVSGIACVVVGIVGYIVCRRDAGQDPFA